MNKKIVLGLGLSSIVASASMIPMGPINAGSGKTVGEGKIRTALIQEYITKDKAYNGSEKIANTTNRKSTKKVTKLKIKYGVSDNFELKAAIPYIKKHSQSSSDYKNSGLGDILLKANYQFLNQKKGDPFFWSASLGVKLDNADTNKVFGSTVVPTMQLGSGSKDYYLETGITRFFERSRFDTYLTYIKTTKGNNEYQYGDTRKIEATYSYAITKPLGLQATLSYMDKQKHKQYGTELDYTGGGIWYLTPAVTYKINKKYDISAGYTRYFKANMNYDPAKNVGELAAGDSFVLKFGMNF